MTKYALLLAAAGFVAFAPAVVKAAETGKHHVSKEAAKETAKEVELADGTKVSIEGDKVFVVAADGTKTAAPDGEHKEKDGKVLNVKDGKLVK